MSFKRVETAADLVRYGCSLRIECTACGAANTMRGIDVAQRCGTGELERIRARLKCRRCGMKESKLFVLPPV